MGSDDRPLKTILIVDDEESILQLLRFSLRREFRVHTANRAETALEILAHQPVDLILSDQRMPGMSGLELFAEVDKKYPDLPRILLSGYAEPQALISVKERPGYYRFLQKPWDHEVLLETIRGMLA